MNYKYLKLNKNILIAFVASIIVSAAVAQIFYEQKDYLNTTITLIVDYIVYFCVFGVLFYVDNKHRYTLESGIVDKIHLKADLLKIITSLGIGEIIYTVSRWSFQYYFLNIDYEPYLASLAGQGLSVLLYMIVINLSVKITKLFDRN